MSAGDIPGPNSLHLCGGSQKVVELALGINLTFPENDDVVGSA